MYKLQIPDDAMIHFDNALYLPMVIKILEMDLLSIEVTPLKFKRPYIKMINQALDQAKSDLKKSNIYLVRRSMKLFKTSSNKDFTEYIFTIGGSQELKKYSSGELRDRTEEIIMEYLNKFTL